MRMLQEHTVCTPPPAKSSVRALKAEGCLLVSEREHHWHKDHPHRGKARPYKVRNLCRLAGPSVLGQFPGVSDPCRC
jgi:hypothetical protein